MFALVPDFAVETGNADFVDVRADEGSTAVVVSRRVVYIVVAAVVAARCSYYQENFDNPQDRHYDGDRMAVIDVGQIGAVRHCRRSLQEDTDQGMVANLGCMVVGSLGLEVLGCCCRSVDGSSNRCNYVVVV